MDTPGKPISQEEFDAMRKAFALKHPEATQSVFYGSHSFLRLLAHPRAGGVRVYFGLDADGNMTAMLRAVDHQGVELMDDPPQDRGQLCPPNC